MGDGGANNTAVLIPYTLKIRSGCEGGGKGALIQTNKSATLSTLNDQYLFQPMSLREENWAESDVRNALRAGESKVSHCVVQKVVDGHILDDQGGSSIGVRTDGKSPTPRAEMHGNVPAVMEPVVYESHPMDSRVKELGEVAPTVSVKWHKGAAYTPLVCQAAQDPVAVECCIDGDKIGKAERAGGSGLGIRPGDKMYTLTAKDAGSHAVCIPINDKATRYKGGGDSRNNDGAGNGLGVGDSGDPSPTLTAGDRHAVAYAMQSHGVDCRNMTEYSELYPTLQAKPNGGQSLNFSGAVRIQYIVRRLTPTECARLQGFADRWGDIDLFPEWTDEDYRFWLDVRNTHAAINGKTVKEYTSQQMLIWYQKLHTDSAEYKMWGNGIALPPALYCMQGIVDALGKEKVHE